MMGIGGLARQFWHQREGMLALAFFLFCSSERNGRQVRWMFLLSWCALNNHLLYLESCNFKDIVAIVNEAKR